MTDPVVLAPPLGGTSRLLAGLVADDAVLVPYEHPGHAGTQAPEPPWTLDDYAHCLLETATCVGVERLAVIGVGFGGMVALAAALVDPDRIASLVVISVSASPGDPQEWRDRARTVRSAGLHSISDAIVGRWVTPATLESSPRLRLDLRSELESCSSEAYGTACDAIAGFEIAERLPEVELPVLVISGTEDLHVPPVRSRELADGLPNARLVELERAAHLPFLDRPTATHHLVADHLGVTAGV